MRERARVIGLVGALGARPSVTVQRMRLCTILLVLGACGDNQVSVDAQIASDAAQDGRTASWSPAITISDPANASFLPVLAVRGGRLIVAWHDFPAGGSTSRVVFRSIQGGGVAGPIEVVPETLGSPKRPAIVATSHGFVLAWDAIDNGVSVIRSIDLDSDGHTIGTPVTISAPGVSGLVPRIAAYKDDLVYAWTNGSQHYFARRGPVETVAATAVGTTLLSGGILNFPRVAVTSSGTILLAYRDGGAQPSDWDVLLVIREIGGTFMGPLDVSRSAGLLSDDISLAIEPGDKLDLVWVDQDPVDVNSFEVTHATRDASGLVSVPSRFGTQSTMTWTPSAAPGLTAAWHSGSGAGGDLWLALAGGAPQPILPGEQGAMSALQQDDSGALHFAYTTIASPRQVRYTLRH
ncbi:MAG: hypothetical protein JWO36_7330 [Myxococcales bacterium]|nr:hypothetical protein [Myxococcales bacterium]